MDIAQRFIDYWNSNIPDVVTGWNIEYYDIPYLSKRLNKVLGEKEMKRLSPWGMNTENEIYIKGRRHLYMMLLVLRNWIIFPYIRSLLIRHRSLIGWIILLV